MQWKPYRGTSPIRNTHPFRTTKGPQAQGYCRVLRGGGGFRATVGSYGGGGFLEVRYACGWPSPLGRCGDRDCAVESAEQKGKVKLGDDSCSCVQSIAMLPAQRFVASVFDGAE